MTEQEKAADRRLRREFYVDETFVFGLEKYNQLLKFQKGVCAICGKPPKGTRLAVDHCHYTGEIRGLLDMYCNRGYGLFVDNRVDRLIKAAEYLLHPPAIQLWGVRKTAPGRLGTKKRAKLLSKMKGGNGRFEQDKSKA